MLSPIGYLISLIGNILTDWELGIILFGSVFMTHTSKNQQFIYIPKGKLLFSSVYLVKLIHGPYFIV